MENEAVRTWNTPRLPFLVLWVGGTAAGWAIGIFPAMILITGALSNGSVTDHPTGMPMSLFVGCFGFMGLILASGVAVAGSQWLAMQEKRSGLADKWFSTGTVCIAVGWFVGWAGSIQPFNTSHGDDKLGAFVTSGIIIGTSIGLIAGIAQWRLLRRQFSHAGWWIAASLLGWISALVIYWLVYQAAGGPFETVVTSYYEGSLWPKTVDAPGAMPAMFVGWIVGGLALGTITGITMRILIGNRKHELPTE